jgi:GNAT superfamily N-acetyltransferase
VHEVREAAPDDNDSLIDLERRAPLDLGDRTLVFDRSPNFFAHQEMQEHGRVLVAEEDGRLVGVVAGAWHDVLIEGQRRRLLYIHQGRVLPEYRRQRTATDLVLQNLALARDAGFDAPYWLISPDNSTSLAFNRQTGVEGWPVDGRIDGFDVSARREARGEVVSVGPSDLPRVLDLINRTHTGREMFLPHTAESLRGRLNRNPTYGWQHWRGYRSEEGLTAAAGIWDFARSLRITEREKTTARERVASPAYVLDYGYLEKAEEPMLEVFMALMAMAAESERNQLSISLPAESRLYSLMEDLPHSTTLFRILTPGIPTPTSIRGSVYLDPVYL